MFEIMDDDGGNDDFIGSITTTVGALMGAKNQTSILDVTNKGKSQGKLIVRCEPISDTGGICSLKKNSLSSNSRQQSL